MLKSIMAGAALAALTLTTPAFAQDAIKVGALRLVSHSPTYLAVERGYFADEGLEVELVYFQAAQPMAVAIASGDVDFGITAVTGGLINLAEKGVVKVVGGALTEEAGIDGQVILASKAAFDDGLTSPAALAGRSYAVTQPGSSFHYMAHKIAAAEGIDTAEVRMVPLQKVGAIVGALKTGQVDAWSIVPNIGAGLAKAPEVEMIGLVSDYIPDYQVTTVFTSTANVEENPDLVKRFLSAFSRGAADFNAALVDKTSGDDAEVVGLIHKYVYTDRPLDQAEPAIRAGGMRISPDAMLSTTSLQDQLDWFQSQGFVDESVTLDTFVDTQFVETK